ncbi:MAG: replicative DNA helicase [Chloroflexi bacterium]|mgnify:CR=1 FL=1|nr:replicative DNA helicase [Chloroflexota bacterium]
MYAEKLPPHDADAEEAVIGSLLIDGESINKIAPLVKPEDFYRERNRWCFEACQSLYRRGESIDQISVARELSLHERLNEVGGSAYLSHVVSATPTSVHIEHFARIVNQTATMRRLIQVAGEIAAIGYADAPDVEVSMQQAEELLFQVRNTHTVRDFVTIREVLDQYLEDTAGLDPMDRGAAPIPTGFPDLDNALGRLQRGDLIILAARPALGKSTLAMNIARNAAGQGAVAAVFSLEMSREQLALRLLSAEAEVDSHLLRLGLLGETATQRVMTSIGELSDLGIYMDDSPAQTVLDMRSKVRRLHTDRGVDLLIVDYLQLIAGNSSGRGENRVQELSEITRQLKAMARDLNVPVIALSQLSRSIEQRPDHYPQLSDLRESGSIEQDADVVAFIHREDKYYTEDQWAERNPTEQYPENLASIIIAKNRHGPTSNIHLYFRGNFMRFENLATEYSGV